MVTWHREPIAFAPSLEQEKDGEFKPETEFRPWDCGHNFYAPQSFNTNGRQIMYGWMSPFVEPIPMQDDDCRACACSWTAAASRSTSTAASRS